MCKHANINATTNAAISDIGCYTILHQKKYSLYDLLTTYIYHDSLLWGLYVAIAKPENLKLTTVQSLIFTNYFLKLKPYKIYL